ncbi:hypothetical protein L4D13_27765, partial [Photobacterium profundum]|uniref:hypothetical protein n=1 Tax=Photobacterium profundum TaxID=74109 RepID=UPI003D0B2337
MFIKYTLSAILLFLHIFSFKIPVLYNSTILASLLSIFLINRKCIFVLHSIFKKKFVYQLLVTFSLPFLYAIVSTVLHSNYDFSFISLYVNNLVYALLTIWLVSIISSFSNGDIDPIKLLVIVVFIQSMIISLSFSSSEILSFVQIFQDSQQAEAASEYYGGGVRGLALSGGQFFNLSAFYTLSLV